MEEVMELSMSIMAHPDPDQFSVNEVGQDAWLDLGKGYSRLQIFLGSNGDVAQAIVDAVAPYLKGNPA